MRAPRISSGTALFLQVVIVLIGISALGLMLWEPHIEGRNAHATNFEIYFKDPFLAYVYVGSIPFFVALHRAFGLFGDARRNGTFSQRTVNALQVIKRCAMTVIGFVAGAVFFIIRFGDGEDRPAGIFMCFLFVFAASTVALAAAVCARALVKALRRAQEGQA